jgi:hypothetical protein
MGIYVDRTDTPSHSSLLLDKEHRLAREELARRVPAGWTREIEADLIMSIETARAIRDWLDQRLKQITEGAQLVGTFTTQPVETES